MDERWLNETMWHVRLSNGQEITQNDAAGINWLSLHKLIPTGERIVDCWLSFRDHEERPLPKNADGYFFRGAVIANLFDVTSLGFYLIGYLMSGTLRVQRWKVPELILINEERRDPNDQELVGPSLWRNAIDNASEYAIIQP